MSYNVTITAQSLEELADKALALGGRLTLASTRQTVTAAQIVEVAKQSAPVSPVYTPPAEIAEVNPVAPAVPDAAPAAPEIPDYDTVVGPAVLALAGKNRAAAQAILRSYKAAKASDVDPTKWAELVDKMNAARLA
jgi:hypothetical protein